MFFFCVCLLLKYGTRKYYITILTNIISWNWLEKRVFWSICYELSHVADLLLDEALRPMNEGPGSYGTAVTVATATTTTTTPPENAFIPAHSPSKLCCRNALKVYRFDHADISKHFLVEDIVLIKLYSLFVQRDFMIVFRPVLILLTGEEHFIFILLFFCFVLFFFPPLDSFNHCVFQGFVNDYREDASYLIVLFYLLKYWFAYSCCKVNTHKKKRYLWFLFGCHLMCKYEKTVYVFPWQY